MANSIKKSQLDINTFVQALEEGKLKDVFDRLHELLNDSPYWGYKEKLQTLEEDYKRILSYVRLDEKIDGQDLIYNKLIRSTFELCWDIILRTQLDVDSSYFFDRLRIRHYSENQSLAQLTQELQAALDQKELLTSTFEANEQINASNRAIETLSKNIFSEVWLSFHYTKENGDLLLNTMKDNRIPSYTKSLIISAITLNMLELFDNQKAAVLLEAVNNDDENIRQRALVGILIFLRKHDKWLYMYPEIIGQLDILSENLWFTKGLRNSILQFIISKETEKITRKIKEELLPKMMKMSSKLQGNFKPEDLLKEGAEEKNPEWEKIIKSEGLENELQKITELQMEGADVMHSSFSHLKNYPFFNEIVNWFIPFESEAEIVSKDKNLSDFAVLLTKSTMMCNSDKYSLFLSVAQMPEQYRKAMTSQFSMESSAISEAMNENSTGTSKQSQAFARLYIQDLYRFFKLYPRRKDFEDIFTATPEFYQVPSIFKLTKDSPDNLKAFGESYFSKNYFKEASDIFGILLKTEPENDILYQKKGYCEQMLGNIDEAIKLYSQAEFLHPNNTWLIKKLALCYRINKLTEDALLYYKKIEKLNPDNLSVQLNIGHCYLELKDYDEALKYYFKVEYLDENKIKAWRPISWCYFLMGQYEKSLEYFLRIEETQLNATDLLNAGHAILAQKKLEASISYYHQAIKLYGDSAQKFLEAFQADIPDLLNAGIKQEDIPLILDRIRYELQ